MSRVSAALSRATSAVFSLAGGFTQLILYKYIQTPNATTRTTSLAAAAGYPKTVTGIIGRRKSDTEGFVDQVLIQGSDFESTQVPTGAIFVQKASGGPEYRIVGGLKPMDPDPGGIVLWRADLSGGHGGSRV